MQPIRQFISVGAVGASRFQNIPNNRDRRACDLARIHGSARFSVVLAAQSFRECTGKRNVGTVTHVILAELSIDSILGSRLFNRVVARPVFIEGRDSLRCFTHFRKRANQHLLTVW
jgi:hypothetical protein